MQLLLVRHGESLGNLTRQLQRHDDPLTDRGRRQASEVAAMLAQRTDIRAIYASPLARALETAQIIGAAVGIAPLPFEGLAEINVGTAAGQTFAVWADSDPIGVQRFRDEGIDFIWPGGESGRQLAARTAATIDAIISAHHLDQGSVIVVSHGGALGWIIAHLLREPRNEWPRHEFHNCSLTEVTVEPDQQAVTFVCRNAIDHLTPEPDEAAALGQTPE